MFCDTWRLTFVIHSVPKGNQTLWFCRPKRNNMSCMFIQKIIQHNKVIKALSEKQKKEKKKDLFRMSRELLMKIVIILAKIHLFNVTLSSSASYYFHKRNDMLAQKKTFFFVLNRKNTSFFRFHLYMLIFSWFDSHIFKQHYKRLGNSLWHCLCDF